MNELIPINYDGEQPTVSARELHKSLEISKRFSAWFETNSQGFIENEDYTSVLTGTEVQNNGGVQIRELQDYFLSVDMAKHICLMSRTEKGKECRQYLIDLEKAWNTPEQVFARALKMADQTIAKLKGSVETLTAEVSVKNQIIGELKPKADYYDEILKNPGLVTITQIAKDYGMSGKKMNDILHDFQIPNFYLQKIQNVILGTQPPASQENRGLNQICNHSIFPCHYLFFYLYNLKDSFSYS